ncbi:MAG: nuclear transport factor 2 family protein [Clostridia bacterium]|nr:nuclear transport factor 2 family protein [Clostridia bacterium]
MEEKDIIRALYSEYWDCMINKDAARLKEMMSDDYYLMHMTGVKQTRDEFLSGLLSGTFNYYSAQHDEITVTISGGAARMTGKSRVTAAVYSGGKSSWRLQGDFTLKKENGNWVFTGSRASTY